MPTKRPLLRLRDIVANGEAVTGYTAGMTFEDYPRHQLTKDASERCLSRISEAAVKRGSFAEEHFADHNWRGIRDLGNLLRHDYPDVLDAIVWKIITTDLPPLLVELKAFLAQYPEDQEAP
ncbi:hypothetical protein CYG48_02015 [Neorhizobium sp. SOG26]|uniref:HepT-like ribonuclease domain-containing protein n=1 Tax=Neorhizobium sp. SOG26 TaxID=2060726 RepID=UPI000E56A76E|nr:HepT-like ribonuclease domain-containing protein [Neorhizobium sp. SOG26]AXV14595.1 hypothetical protein CYG48_02015 [Neorhizobium sp. SOG26]